MWNVWAITASCCWPTHPSLDVSQWVCNVWVSHYTEPDCYQWAIKKTRYMQECELNLIVVEGKSYCQDCRKTYRTTEYGKACPYCGGYHTYLVSGRDVMIRDIQAV